MVYKAAMMSLVIWTFSVALAPAQNITPPIGSLLEPIIQEVMIQHDIPGLAVAVVNNRQVLYAQGFGTRISTNKSDEITPRTLFHMASVTKLFVATSVMQLAEQGLVNLDAPIVRYLPYFRMKAGAYQDITVRHMLTHTAGMPDETDYEWDRPQYDAGALERYVRSLSNHAMISEPGAEFQYSNMAYEALGDLIAKVSGKTFEDYVAAHIFAPLGMQESTLLHADADPSLFARPHVLDGAYQVSVSEVYPYNRSHAPSSTLKSNLHDMSRWIMANLNRGALEGRRILSETAYDTMWTPTDEQWGHAGIGWFLGEHRGYRTVGHSGGDVGFASNLVLIPDQSIGVVVMSNCKWAPVQQITGVALDIALGFEPMPMKGLVNLQLDKILYHTIIQDGGEKAVEQYHTLRAQADPGFDFNQVWQLRGLGQNLLKQGRTKDAIRMFQLNVEAYPRMSFLITDLAEAYLADGNKDLAIQSYEKALSLDPDNGALAEIVRKLRENER